ncbi:MAG: helix-turn-helix domain-containing protein [Candidatus Moranbacteria bacterium]|nr:helix-turn-helix domain-containing protein [Candidatus Moranbacteria bacterium]
MEEEKPNYYSILTADVRYDTKLSPTAKILYSEITALSNKNGYCTASNGYFSKLYSLTIRSISNAISTLKEQGYIQVVQVVSNKEVIERKIYPLSSPKTSIPLEKNFYTPMEKNFLIPLEKNFQDNITSKTFNTTSINKKIPLEKKEQYAEFVSMTEKEHNTLIEKYGEEKTNMCIERLDNYKGSNGKTYKSDYRAILSWVAAEVDKDLKKQLPKKEMQHTEYDDIPF